ncbi:MAG TPA: hypothetical protein VFJ30_10015, partial [Phycisphaerae bacterium]|nr:hypothetical protein [Phycisphaerae bacterium]
MPRVSSVFADVCMLLPVAVALVLFLLHGPAVFIWMLVLVIAIFALAWFLGALLWSPSSITLSDQGIRIRRRVHPWDGIVKIDKRLFRATTIVLRRKGQMALGFLPWPVVVRDILPEIVRRCPAATVTKRARRLLDDPRRAEHSRWVVPTLLGLTAWMVAFPIAVRYAGFWTVAAIQVSLMVTSAVLVFLVWPPHTQALRLAGNAIWQLPSLLLIYIVLLVDAPVRSADTLCAILATLAVAAAIAHGRRLTLGRRGQTAILCAAVAAGGLAYGADAWTAWHREDITSVLKADMPLAPFTWSDDGSKLLVNWVADYARNEAEQQIVADLAAGTAAVLPPHKGASVTSTLGATCVIRYVKGEGKEDRQLYLYRFADGREVLLSANSLSHFALYGPPVSPTGRAVCWLENAQAISLKVHDVSTGRTRTLDVAWPAEEGLEWCEALWIDEETVGVVGFERGREGEEKARHSRLHTLRVHIRDLTTEHLVGPRGFRYGLPSPDLTRAFASGFHGYEYLVYYVDLRTGRTQPMGGGDMPTWTRDGQQAF